MYIIWLGVSYTSVCYFLGDISTTTAVRIAFFSFSCETCWLDRLWCVRIYYFGFTRKLRIILLCETNTLRYWQPARPLTGWPLALFFVGRGESLFLSIVRRASHLFIQVVSCWIILLAVELSYHTSGTNERSIRQELHRVWFAGASEDLWWGLYVLADVMGFIYNESIDRAVVASIRYVCCVRV